MAAVTKLLGPPAAAILLGQPESSSPAIQTSIEDDNMDSIVFQTENLNLDSKPSSAIIGLTENSSPTFLASGNPCLDFFFHVVPSTPVNDLIARLKLAWIHDSLTTLKLICNLRGVRGTGKSDKEGFYNIALWLHKIHPKTLALNLRVFAYFGYLKDLPEILYRLLEGPEIRSIVKGGRKNRKTKRRKKSSVMFKRETSGKLSMSEKEKEGLLENLEELGDKEKARALRKANEIAKSRKASDRYRNDLDYRFLFDCVSDVFAELLKLDIGFLNSGDVFKISFASKWCPSIDSSYDKATLICEGIARRIFPRDCEKEYEGIEEAHYVYRIRDRLRKQVLVPLHRALDLPEVYMSSNEWNTLPYNRVPSVAMKNYKGLFSKHDDERFDNYLEQVQSGKAKIAAGALLPHQLVKSLNKEADNRVTELQWARMVEDLTKKGNLRNCIAICDVSGSMHGIPMEVSVSLGLLVSELSEDPWKGKVITFSEDPQLHLIKGDSLKSKTEFIRKMNWGGNTDFQKVFDRILEVAVEGNLSEDQMIKRVFVFSDMEFDDASVSRNRCYNYDSESDDDGQKQELERSWETDYETILRKYKEKGYNKVPEIVFWNLRNSSSTPVPAKQSGVAMVSGFSKNLLTLFLEKGGIVNPEDVMTLAISGNEYKKLVIYD